VSAVKVYTINAAIDGIATVLATVDTAAVALAKVDEALTQYSRVWVTDALSRDINLDHLRMLADRGSQGHNS
jgi:hypothetical protein